MERVSGHIAGNICVVEREGKAALEYLRWWVVFCMIQNEQLESTVDRLPASSE